VIEFPDKINIFATQLLLIHLSEQMSKKLIYFECVNWGWYIQREKFCWQELKVLTYYGIEKKA
jgi:hypothetical protein